MWTKIKVSSWPLSRAGEFGFAVWRWMMYYFIIDKIIFYWLKLNISPTLWLVTARDLRFFLMLLSLLLILMTKLIFYHPCLYENIFKRNLLTKFLVLDVPAAFKYANVQPLLKKRNLDISVLSNFRPISKLLFLSRVL